MFTFSDTVAHFTILQTIATQNAHEFDYLYKFSITTCMFRDHIFSNCHQKFWNNYCKTLNDDLMLSNPPATVTVALIPLIMCLQKLPPERIVFEWIGYLKRKMRIRLFPFDP